MDKLSEIMAWKRQEIAARVRLVAPEELQACAARPAEGAVPLRAALAPEGRLAVIAEMKRRSPSAGAIAEERSAVEQAGAYAHAGADAISVLTDNRFFGGSLEDLAAVTAHLRAHRSPVPCLRKDFMVHPVQVLEAAQAGARAILIIVRALPEAGIAALFEAAELAGLDALFEVHSEPEIERAVRAGARIIGVNNRDLARFRTDLTLSEKLIPLIPRDVVAVSESGIHTPADAARVRAAGARAVLVGEALMRAPRPDELLRQLQEA